MSAEDDAAREERLAGREGRLTPLVDLAELGFTHIEVTCPGCGYIVHIPYKLLPKGSMALTLEAIAPKLRCKRCSTKPPLDAVHPWSMADANPKGKGRWLPGR